MRMYSLLLVLLLPLASFSQGVLEKMQADIIAASKMGADNATEIVKLKERIAALEKVIVPPVPGPGPDPVPDPKPDPEPVPTGDMQLKLLGGWRVTGEFPVGSMAIDHANKKLYMAGHAQRQEVYEYTLPVHGAAIDINTWPKLVREKLIPGWWGAGYANGLTVHGGKLWACPRVFYDMHPPSETDIVASTGEKMIVAVPRQSYAGFVKSAGHSTRNGLEVPFPMIGGGGYESGQGSAFGPSLSRMNGQTVVLPARAEKKDTNGKVVVTALPERTAFTADILIRRSFASTWDNRERRDTTYWPKNGVDGWTALVPKDVDGDGKVDGCWACDRIYAGGIKHSTGIYYWPWMATSGPDGKPGIIDYDLQNETFCVTNQTYIYRYDPLTYKLISYKPFPVNNRILGQDISPDGKYLYLMLANQWISGMYKVDPVLQIYEIVSAAAQ